VKRFSCQTNLYAACVLLLTCLCSVRAASGPVAYYAFDEASGTIALDSSGNGNNGALTGGVTRVPGVLNGALAFDGATGYVSIPNSPNLTGGSVSVAAWIYRQSGVQKKFVSKWDDNSGNYQFDFQVYTDSKLWFQLQNGANVGLIWRGTTVINLNQWYHVAAVADASTGQVSLYVNGALETLQSQSSWDGTVRNVNMEMNIGRKATGGDYWNGFIDDARVYNRVLSQAEITTLASAPPLAAADYYVTPPNQALSVSTRGVLANDSSFNGGVLSAVLDASVSNGTLALNANGSFNYTPANGFAGSDTFTYHAVDSNNLSSSPATVSILVQIPVPGLIAYYPLDEGSGTVANDASGNGKTGTLVNGPVWTSGIKNGALSFDGVDDQVQLPDNLIHDNTTLTIAVWFKTTTSGVLIGQQNAPLTNFVPTLYVGTDGHLRGEYWTGTANPIASSKSVTDGQWHHAALTGAVSTQSLYLDGQLVGSLSGTIDMLDMSKNQLGAARANFGSAWTAGGSAILSGALDDVRFYNRVLSISEIQTLAYQPPVAVNDTYAVPVNTAFPVAAPGVLSNDINTGNLALTAVLDSNVSNGVLALNSNGSFTYTPSAGFVGTDSFTYHILDSNSQSSNIATVSLAIVTRWHLTIPISGTYQVPSGSIYTPVFAVATFGDPSGTINFIEITDTDNQSGGRNYDCEALLHTSSTIDNSTSFSGQAGAGQIGRDTSGYPDVMTFYAQYDFETAAFATSTPGSGTYIIQGRNPLAFDSTETLYARCWFNRGDGHPGPLISNLSILADITCVHMPGAVMQGSSQNALTWTPSPANAAVNQQLYRAATATGPFTLLQSFSDNTTSSYTDSTMTGGSIYYFKVVAQGVGGIIGADSNVLAVTGCLPTVSTCNTPAAINYGVTTAALSATVGASQAVNTGTITFQLKSGANNVGTAVVSGTVTNGTVSVSYAIPTGTPAGNYTIVASYNGSSTFFSSADNSKQLSISAAPLTVSANSFTRAYGSANPTLTGTLVGIKYGDNITATYATSGVASSIIGNYSIVPTLADPGGKLTNYVVTSNNGSLTVTAAPLSVVPANFNRFYGTANPTLTGTIVGVKNGDNITATYATSATVLSAVGPYSIVPTLIDPNNKLSNYAVTSNNGTLTITRTPLSAAAFNTTRAYGTANPTFSGTLSGVVNGDNILAIYNSSATVTSTVGFYPITPSLLDPDGKQSNYAVTLSNGTLNVTQAPLSVAAASVSRPYGSVNPTLTGAITGIQNNDNITATYATSATPQSLLGTYNIVPTLDDPGSKLSNYSVTSSNGTLTVGTAALTVTPANASKTYGDANPVLSGTVSGVQNGDNITASYSTLATPGSAAGPYSVTATLSDPGNKLPNYGVTLNTGTLTINPAPLTATADDASRIYGAPDPLFAGTLTGVVNGDNITATFIAGTSAASHAGTYPITAVLADPGNKLGNYALTSTNGTLTILKSTPVIAWPSPAGIFAGVPLDLSQLNASASDSLSNATVSGSFTYTPGSGTVLAPSLGQALSVVFMPEDAVDYNSTSANNTIDVNPAIPVAITSAQSASGVQNTSFTYTITATGSAPMTFNADGLPGGLSLLGAVISGNPTSTGVFDIVLTVSNYAGSASQPLKLVVTPSGGTNHAPVFSSPPTSTANPATTGVPVTLTASATDADGDALDYAWDFGDGTTAMGASVSKSFAAAGVYVVKVVVSDGQVSASQSINLIVEDQLPSGLFAVQNVAIAFNFTRSGKDNLSISGQIPVPAGFNPTGKTMRVLIGGLDKTYTLSARGASADKALSVRIKPGATNAIFSFTLKNQALFALLQPLGFSKTQSNPALNFTVVVTLDGQSYLDRPVINYAVKSNRLGPVKGKGKK